MEDRHYLYAGILLVLLSIIPIWIIPIAPLADWPIHLALSHESYLLWQNQLTHPIYFLDFSFLGYSGLSFLLMILQTAMSLETAGKVVLTLLFVLTPLCWLAFFRILEPKKQSWAIFGLLLNYSIFFYWGTIAFLFAINIGLVWLALGLEAILKKRFRSLPFFLAGLLAFLFHIYAFLMVGGLMLLILVYSVMYKSRPVSLAMPALLVLLLLAGLWNTIHNPTHSLDYTYTFQVIQCAQQVEFNSIYSQDRLFTPNKIATHVIDGILQRPLDPLEFLSSVFPLSHLAFFLILIGIGIALYCIREFFMASQPIGKTITSLLPWKIEITWDRAYLVVVALLLVHYFIVPECSDVCGLNQRSLPLAMAFFLLAIGVSPGTRKAIFWLIFAIVAINIVYQTYIFANEAPAQAQILSQLRNISSQLPPNATVFVPPASWNTGNNYFGYPPYGHPHYHAMVLVYDPSAYVSGLFMHQQTFVIRSNFPLFDELIGLGPNPLEYQSNISVCYAHPPSNFQWVIDENMQLRHNPANSS